MTADIHQLDPSAAAPPSRRACALVTPRGPRTAALPVSAPAPQAERWFARALGAAGLAGQRVLAIGLNSSELIAHLIEVCGVAYLTACDCDAIAARRNGRALHQRLPHAASRLSLLASSKPLLDGSAARFAAAGSHAIVVELPLRAHDEPGTAPYRRLGLGALEALLDQCRSYAPHARLIVAAHGELGFDVWRGLFRAYAYGLRALERGLLPLDEHDDLPPLVTLERMARRLPAMQRYGFSDCELYLDAHGEERINARDCAVLAQCGLPASVRRPWFVLEAVPQPAAA